ncbi:type VI secretion system Vgr family protein [Sorangium sp. So ce118]
MALLELTLASGELSVRRFVVQEAVSSLFSVSIWGRSPDPSLDLEALLDGPATFRCASGYAHVAGLGRRTWTGIVTDAELVHAVQPAAGQKGLSTYRVQIAPELFRLVQRRGNRTFQHLSIPDIIDALLAEWSIEKVWRIDRGRHPRLEYKVQYGESDYAFFSRLLEEAGIAFTFPEDQGGRLTLCDRLEASPVRPGPPIPYVDPPGQAFDREFVTAVRLAREVRPGAFSIRDHEFRNPDFALLSEVPRAGGIEARNEQYHFDQGATLVETGKGGGTPVADDRGIARHDPRYGEELAERSLHGERVGARGASFAANTFDLAPGVIFRMDWHPHPELPADRPLLVLETSLEGTAEGEWSVSGQVVFADAPYRPPRRTPKPVVHGLQSATVVGPPGQEIHTDEFGRVRVQFPWDREGRRDDGSSCWVRVSQGWGGMGYGMIVLPRIGQEVLVAFAEGDPDLPFVIGRVYNAMQQVPYRLPEHATRSTWKSGSSPGSGGFNEIMFEDLATEELVWQQAAKDRTRLVKNDERATVGHDRQKLVKNDESERTEGFRKRRVGKDADEVTKQAKRERIGGDVSVQVRGARAEQIDGKRSLAVVGERQEKVEGRYALRAKGQAHYAAGEAIVAEAAQDFTLAGPGGFLRIDASGVTIEGTVVKINVSGKPGKGKGSKPEAPAQPEVELPPHDGHFVVIDEESNAPVTGQRYRITRESGEVIEGRTDERGSTQVVATNGPERLSLELLPDRGAELRPKADKGP